MASTMDCLRILSAHDVEYVVVGGIAGFLHASPLVTEDVDICAPLSIPNLAKLLAALRDCKPGILPLPNSLGK